VRFVSHEDKKIKKALGAVEIQNQAFKKEPRHSREGGNPSPDSFALKQL
jgi:hypothetical protein